MLHWSNVFVIISKLKIDYGFYEFMSSTYAPYCLSGLLNLGRLLRKTWRDKGRWPRKQSKRLLGEMLIVDKRPRGVFFPSASGRNYHREIHQCPLVRTIQFT
jgi:hypothetical protein